MLCVGDKDGEINKPWSWAAQVGLGEHWLQPMGSVFPASGISQPPSLCPYKEKQKDSSQLSVAAPSDSAGLGQSGRANWPPHL